MNKLACMLVGWFCLLALAGSPLKAASYGGQDIDGTLYEAEVYSYCQGSHYTLGVEFDGSDVIIHFPNGGYIVCSLDDEEIEDLSAISAFHYEKGCYWDIDLS